MQGKTEVIKSLMFLCIIVYKHAAFYDSRGFKVKNNYSDNYDDVEKEKQI